MSATQSIRYGNPGKRGTYRCADCDYEISVRDLKSMPPCPRSSDLPHEEHAWQRRGNGLAWAIGLGLLGVGALAATHLLGTRRIADEARRLAAEGRHYAERGLLHAESGLERARRTTQDFLS